MATPFTFTLDSFQITDTRSLHKDTDTSHSLLWLDPSDSSMMLPPKKTSPAVTVSGAFSRV
jgi:hypothetical protein